MRTAIASVERIATVLARSRVYETAPVGVTDQPSFLNAAILVECTLSPLDLLDALLAIEKQLGRGRAEDTIRWGPRTIDLDVLWIGGLVVDDPRLQVPHPRLAGRAFALIPLLDVVPEAPYGAPADAGVRLSNLTLL